MSDTSETTFATVRASVPKLQKLFREASLNADKASKDERKHSDVYLNILPDRVEVLQKSAGKTILTFGSYSADFFDEIDVETDVETIEVSDEDGETVEYDVGAEAIIDVEKTLNYLSYSVQGTDETVVFTFSGEEDERLARRLDIEGALRAWYRLPFSGEALNRVPMWLPSRFSDDNVYCSPEGTEAPTRIRVNTETLEHLIDITEQNPETVNYALVVDDGDLRIDVGDEDSEGVSGSLGVQNLEGPDIENYYHDGFTEIVGVFSGDVELQSGPGNNPVAFVQVDEANRALHHVNGSVTKR